jgi:uncharacterized membrane protein
MGYCLHPRFPTTDMTDDIDGTSSRLKQPLCYAMGLFYVGAGVLHFVAPKIYARVVPPQFPRSVALVYLSGIAEIGLGIGVMVQRTRRLSAWGLIALLLAVFPANVHMATMRSELMRSLTGLAASPGWRCGRGSHSRVF